MIGPPEPRDAKQILAEALRRRLKVRPDVTEFFRSILENL